MAGHSKYLLKLHEALKSINKLKEILEEEELEFLRSMFKVLSQAQYRRDLEDKEKRRVNALLKKANALPSKEQMALADFADRRDVKSKMKSVGGRLIRSAAEQRKLANKAAKRKRKKAARAAQNQAQVTTPTDLAN